MPKATNTGAVLLVALAALLWSTGGVGVKLIELPSMALAGYRSLFAAIMMTLVLLYRARTTKASLADLARRPVLYGAAAAYTIMVVAFVVAAKLTTAANAIFIQYTGPIYVALLSGPILSERPRRGDWFAVAGCIFGMAIFFSDKLSADAQTGNLVAVVSSFGFGALPVLLRYDQRKTAKPPGENGTNALAPMFAMVMGNYLAVLFCAPSMANHRPNTGVAWGAVIGLGILQIGLPYVLYGIAVRHLRALESSLIAMLEPIVSPLWAFLGAGETPSQRAMIGGAIILGSVGLQIVGARAKLKDT